MLCIWHGFYYGAHRAMNDVNATIHLLKHPSYTENPPLLEIINNAKKPNFKIVNTFPYNEEHIKLIKQRNVYYKYNSNDKSWSTILNDEKKLEEEKNWLKENIYGGYFKGRIELISVFDKYKDNV